MQKNVRSESIIVTKLSSPRLCSQCDGAVRHSGDQ